SLMYPSIIGTIQFVSIQIEFKCDTKLINLFYMENDMLKMIQTSRDEARGGHYSHAVRAGDFVYVSGPTPRDALRTVIGNTIEEQTAITLENVRLALEAAGGALEDVVKVGVFLSDLADAARFDLVYASHFPTFR